MIQAVPSLLDFGTSLGIVAVIALIILDIVIRLLWKKSTKILSEHDDAIDAIKQLHKAFLAEDGKSLISRADIIRKIGNVEDLMLKLSDEIRATNDELRKVCSAERCPSWAKVTEAAGEISDITITFDNWREEARQSRAETRKLIEEIRASIISFIQTVGMEMVRALRGNKKKCWEEAPDDYDNPIGPREEADPRRTPAKGRKIDPGVGGR